VSLKVRKRITFIEKVKPKEMPNIYSLADYLVHYSKSEVGPLVFLESLSCGVPIITNVDSDGIGIVENGINGYKTKKITKTFIKNKLKHIGKNKDHFKLNARKTIIDNNLSWVSVARKYERTFFDVLNE
jgi:glycosyltransferase involved in cell wall biosynthesis